MPLSSYLKPGSFFQKMTVHLNNGWVGVDIFFCLSSFLLTSLLMMEYKDTAAISIKKFLIRRALRIWPLYYLMLLLSFLVFPIFGLFSHPLHTAEYTLFKNQHLLPYSLFLGNFSYMYFVTSLTLPMGLLWTISLEEQFYLIWPIALSVLLPSKKRWFFIALTGMVLLSMIVRFYLIKNSIPYPTIWVFTLARLDAFALGALLAYLFLNKISFIHPLIALLISIFLFIIVFWLPGYKMASTFWELFVVDLAAALLIYAAIYSKGLAKCLSFGPLPWLGQISFGLYIYHNLMIHIVLSYFVPFIKKYIIFPKSPIASWYLTFAIIFLFTIICATLSYYLYENPFLKLKKKFDPIKADHEKNATPYQGTETLEFETK